MTDPYPAGATQRDYAEEATKEQRVEASSVGELVSKVTSDLSALMHQEVDLLKAELKEEVAKVTKPAGMFGGSGLAVYFSVFFLSLAAMFALGSNMSLGWAALIVCLVWAAAASILFLQGKEETKKVNFVPNQTIQTLKEDAQWVKNPTR